MSREYRAVKRAEPGDRKRLHGQGEPEGWYRNRRTGRRRPDGDPAREYVAP